MASTSAATSSEAASTRPPCDGAAMLMEHDAIVIGSDEIACATAIEAAKRGLDVLLIEDQPGGPGEATRRASILRCKIRETISHRLATRELLAHCSSSPPAPLLSAQAIRVLRLRVAEHYHPTLRRRLAELGVRETSGSPRFVSPHRILLEPHGVLTAPIIAIAVGSRPRHPKRFTFDQRVICDHQTVVQFDRPPRHLLIVGAEAVGLEFACVFNALGSDVTLLDRRYHTLRYVDRQLRKVLYARIHSLGINLVLGEELNEMRICDLDVAPHAKVTLSSGRVERCDRVLIEAGSSPNTETLGLHEVGIQTDRSGFIIIDEHQQTSQPGVYAVGDVIGNLGSVDLRQPRIAIQHALGGEVEFSDVAPLVIHTTPPISMLGLTEEMCQRLDFPHVVGIARYSDLPALQVLGTDEGMLKLVVSRSDRRLIGVHLIGEGATELVHVGAALVSSGAGVDELANCPFVAHSLFEAYLLAAEDALQRLAARRPVVARLHATQRRV